MTFYKLKCNKELRLSLLCYDATIFQPEKIAMAVTTQSLLKKVGNDELKARITELKKVVKDSNKETLCYLNADFSLIFEDEAKALMAEYNSANLAKLRDRLGNPFKLNDRVVFLDEYRLGEVVGIHYDDGYYQQRNLLVIKELEPEKVRKLNGYPAATLNKSVAVESHQTVNLSALNNIDFSALF